MESDNDGNDFYAISNKQLAHLRRSTKGLELINKGRKINYEGATNIEFSINGKIKGSFLEQVVKDGKFKSQHQR